MKFCLNVCMSSRFCLSSSFSQDQMGQVVFQVNRCGYRTLWDSLDIFWKERFTKYDKLKSLLYSGKQDPTAVAAVRLLFLHLCLPHAGEISQAGCEIYCFKFILFFLPKIANPMLARYRKQDVRFVVFNSISWLTQKSIICFQLQMSLRMRQSHPNLKTLFSNCGTMRHGAQDPLRAAT